MEKWSEEGAYKHYETLLQMGGRPTRSINRDPGVWDPAKVNLEDIHVLNHWGGEMSRMQDELDRWKHFRTFQQLNRAKPENFSRYQEHVLNYRRENGMEGTAHLHLQPAEQTKLDEWREYQFYEHRKLGRLKRVVTQAEGTAESARKRLDAAESDESRAAMHETLSIYQGRIRSAEVYVEEANELLSWIDSQFPLIESEGPLSQQEIGGEGHNSRDQEPTGDVASHSTASTTLDLKSQNPKKQDSKVLGAVHSGKISKAVRKRPRLVLPRMRLPRRAGSLSGDNPDKGLPDGAAQAPSYMDQALRTVEDNQLTSTTGSG